MDYANERWVRLYTRDTTTWKLLTWEARALLAFLLRKVDRSGVLEVGDEGVEGLTAHVEMPLEVVERVLPELLKRGVLVDGEYRGRRAFIFPNFKPAQETPASDKQRAAESRANRRSETLNTSRNVTGESRNVMEPSRAVTASHAASHAVTPTDPTETAKPTERETGSPVLVLLPQEADPPKPPDSVERLWAEQERLRREVMPKSRGIKLTDDRRKRVQDRLDDGYSEDDCMAVLAEYAREARINGGEWFNGETNWRPENFARSLGRVGAEARAGPTPSVAGIRSIPKL